MSLIGLINELVPTGWPALVLVSARVIGVMVTAPMWSMQVLPANTRVAAAIVLTIALLPSAPVVPVPEEVLALPGPVAVELLLGIAIGLTASLFLHGAAIAGEIVSVQMGLSIAGALAPSTGVSGPGIGALQSIMAIAMYFVLGGHLMLIRGMAESLQVIPPGGGVAFGSGMQNIVDMAASTFVTAARVAAPLMVAMMLANAVLAMLSRAVPQINTLMVAFPITIGLGFIIFSASLPFLVRIMHEWVFGLPADVERAISGFAVVR